MIDGVTGSQSSRPETVTESSAPKYGKAPDADSRAEGAGPLGAAAVPAISIPNGGGAIRGIGEKFSVNAVNGTSSMSVPLGASPGRAGFGPQLTLSYDSGSGNGPFGFGWSLAVPSIARKTDKGLPQYHDGDESDVFILSGSEDLVPVLLPGGSRYTDSATAPGFTIDRYRPRTEGLFARIERWTESATGNVHWRSISRDNVTTIYGETAESRVADGNRVFTWLICASYDDRGHAVVYSYVGEDDANVDQFQLNERNRSRTANRYLKRVKYGNKVSRLMQNDLSAADWLFEVVFDYDEDHYEEVGQDATRPASEQHRFVRASPSPGASWSVRPDPFSSYRSGFEVRTYRRCRRVLMFHHFPELGAAPYMVRATEFDYADFDYSQPAVIEVELAHQGSTRFASFICSVTHSGFVRDESQAILRRNGVNYVTYLAKSLPPVEFSYTKAVIQDAVHELDSSSLENLPAGVDGSRYQWVDLEGEGVSGILAEQPGAWFYKPSLGSGGFGVTQTVAAKPSLASLSRGSQRLLDLVGDGHLDLVDFRGPTPGYYERTDAENWKEFRPFARLPTVRWDDPNLRFVDLNGDGHADVLVTEDDAFTWYSSLAEDGFGPSARVVKPWDEELGPRLLFADGTQSIYLADMSGDGLNDLTRIRNGDICYWPNLGYGRFGAKVTMDNAPWLDHPDEFDEGRVRLADIDGSGTNDLIYLGRDSVRLYFNQSGNRWSQSRPLSNFPMIDNVAAVTPADILGNGTACLVWSSPLPADASRSMRYVDLMGGTKPHLLVNSVNNLGTETRVHYAASTKFYLADKQAGKPWITRVPFPIHVVERVEIDDRISRNRFVTCYAYHHGYFDGVEREFRGFGLVEQWDTEEFAALTDDGRLPAATNVDAASHVPPVFTRTWFHTGIYYGRDHVSDFFAGLLDDLDSGEYYREPGLTDAQARERLLEDTVLPAGLTVDEEREACRALKGSMLRQEIYAHDGGADQASQERARNPYTVIEQNFRISLVQSRGENRHSVFLTHPLETITYHYERNPTDPRVQHVVTLELDPFGNVLKEAMIGYGRRQPDPTLPLQVDRDEQAKTLVTYTEHSVTNAIDQVAVFPHDYRVPQPCDTRTYQLTGYVPSGAAGRFQSSDFVHTVGGSPTLTFDSQIHYEESPTNGRQPRLIEQIRTLYRADDLAVLLPLGHVEPLALPGESYKLAFTPGLLTQVFQRNGQPLLPNPANVLGGQAGDRGGYVPSQQFKADGRFPNTDPDDHWWIPGGLTFLSPDSNDTAPQEFAYARAHFLLTHRIRDPFHSNATATESFVTYDAYDLLMVETRDALGNRITAGERRPNGTIDPGVQGNDYRVLHPCRVMDPNRNRIQAAFDALGMVVGAAAMGKPGENLGDSLDGFVADLTDAATVDHLANPFTDPKGILRRATRRHVYDLLAYYRTKDQPDSVPLVAYTLARETHDADLQAGEDTKVQHSFSYSDGFSREIQRKLQAEPGPMVDGGPVVTRRWVGSGWTVFNNKGKPVRQYEPFFSTTPGFEFGAQVGVSSILFYDAVDRVVATLHPNHTYEKVVCDPWRHVTWDVNDTVLGDPRADADIQGYTAGYFAGLPASPPAPLWQTWHAQRKGGAMGALEQSAASKAAAHAGTPTKAYFDTLGRPYLTLADNGPDLAQQGVHFFCATRIELDVEGNQRAVRDAVEQAGDKQGRIVMRYAYDMLGERIFELSMEAGARWMLNDVAGKAIRVWDSRGNTFSTDYDALRRPLRFFVTGADPVNPNKALLTERLVYGEQHPDAEPRNLYRKLYLHLDQAGSVANEAHDFKGNTLLASRRLTSGTQYRQAMDWRAVDGDHVALPGDGIAPLDLVALETALLPLLEPDSYSSSTTYDALSRPVMLTTPHTPAMQANIIRPGYNESNLLQRVDANMRSAMSNGQPVWTSLVSNIDYDAKGQRQRIAYGNGVSTSYEYDPLTFRLAHLLTSRDKFAFPADCPQPRPAGWPGCQIQDLQYTYDPKGNVTHIRDDAQQTIFFRNKRVEPSAEYTYDALNRLTEATGREHLGQVGGAPVPSSQSDAPHVAIDWSANDGNAMGTYTERYLYDSVGNVRETRHRGENPAQPGWTRTYVYGETSLIEDGTGGSLLKSSNRLSSTTVGNNNPDPYLYDAHGNATRMPYLGGAYPAANLHWDDRNQLHQADLGAGSTDYYVYDASGNRARKVWEKSANLLEERIYFSGFEIYRKRQGPDQLIRETLHVMDDKRRIAVVETRTADTAGTDTAPQQLVRYQFENHLGSATLELSDQAQIISYEEYTPYGNTSYQAVRSQTETPKRYRHTGKERDEETGLYYQGARYYAPHLCRWLAPDPLGVKTSVNLYSYVNNQPISFVDPNGRQATPVADKDTVGKPGFWESLIPIWGSGRDAIYNFQKGSWGWGLAYTALAVTDVFLVKALVTGVAKGVVKGGVKLGVEELAARELAVKEAAARELAAKEAAARELAAKEAAARELAAKEAAAKEAAAKEAAAKEAAAKEAAAKEAAAKEAAAKEAAAKEAAAKQAAAKQAAGKAAQAHANTLHHIFSQARHKLENLVKLFGSEEKAFNAVQRATEGAVRSQGLKGLFETTVKVGTETITVRGRVIDGLVRISTFFKP